MTVDLGLKAGMRIVNKYALNGTKDKKAMHNLLPWYVSDGGGHDTINGVCLFLAKKLWIGDRKWVTIAGADAIIDEFIWCSVGIAPFIGRLGLGYTLSDASLTKLEQTMVDNKLKKSENESTADKLLCIMEDDPNVEFCAYFDTFQR